MTIENALIVDDDPMFCIIAETTLLACGWQHVSTAEDGAQGAKAIISNDTDVSLIIMDLNMPGLDGIQVMKHLAASEYHGDLIICSSETSDVVEGAQRLGELSGLNVLGCLGKPLDATRLSSLLAKRCHEQSAKKNKATISLGELNSVLETAPFVPFFQPKINLHTGVTDTVEVLTRFRNSSGGLTSPVPFIEGFEAHDLMPAFTDVFVSKLLEEFRSAPFLINRFGFAINISPQSLESVRFADEIDQRLASAGICPSRITLEITESSLLSYESRILETLTRLRMKGFKLSIDDFGTGATTIQQLRQFPFSELKIDKSYVDGIWSDRFSQEVIRSSIALAKQVGLSVVAEGVEDFPTLEYLKEMGVDTIQGYVIAKPMPMSDLVAFDPVGHMERLCA